MHTETQNMMKRNAIALAVAAICGSPLAATAHWEVITPSSVSESAPQLLSASHLPPAPPSASTAMAAEANTPVAYTETATTSSAEISGRGSRTNERRQRSATPRSHIARAGGMANPQTPYSPNESGEQRYTQEMQEYKQQLASVEQARIATAESYAPPPAVAQVEPARVQNDAAAAEVDRLLATPATPTPDRDQQTVATVTPALVDSRASATNDLRVESGATGEPARDAASSNVPAETGRSELTATAPVDTTPIGGAAQPAIGATSTVATEQAAVGTTSSGATEPVIGSTGSVATDPALGTTSAGAAEPTVATSTIAAAPSAPIRESMPVEAAPAAPADIAAAPAPTAPVGATATPATAAVTQGSGPAQ
jgi:hypothetical protein